MPQDLAYKVSTNSRVIELEKELLKELEDLKHEVEDADLELGNKSKSLSSLGGLKDASFFKLERQMIINKLIETRQVKPVQIQADIMKEEATVALQPEYNQIGLPLLLHQFYLDKIEQMANLKYLYLLRFTRFCSRSQKVEAIYEDYQGTLKYVMSEYMDAIGRAKRLSCAHNAAVVGDLSRSLGSVNAEDIIIYLSWIICHLHSIKKINSFMKILQWMPISHAHLLNKEKILENSKVREDATHTNADASLIHPRGTSFQLMHYFSTLPNDSTSGIATSQSNNIAYDGFKIPSKHSGHISGLSSIEIGKLSLHLPRHETDLEDFKSELESLLQFFSLNELSVNQIQTIADEAEFYFHVAQGFKKRFDRQQMERCFPTYNTAVSEPKFGIEKWGVKWNCSYEQEANWISFRRIRPTSNIGRERNMAQLWHHNDIDELLRINSIFLNIGNSEIILESLKKHVKSMVNPPNYFPTKVTTNASATQDTATLWHKLYNFFKDRCDNNDDSVSNTFEEDTIASHSTRGFSNSRTAASAVNYSNSKTESAGIHRRSRMESESTFESISATQLLGLDDEDDNIADSTNGAYLSYLLLRHLKIRDLRRSVLSDLNYFRSLERTLTIDDNNGLALSTNSQQAKVSQSMFMEFSEVRNRDDYYSFEDGRVHVRDQNGYYILYDVAKKDLRKIEEELLLIGSYYIRKDKSLKHKIIPKGPGIKKHKRMLLIRNQSHQSTDNVDMVKDGHQFIDRFAVLRDLWYGEAIYQESKRQIIDCYMEVYNTIYDPKERRQVAKIVTNLINDRPNFDFTEDYFLRSYQASSAALNGRFKLIKTILSDQIDESREYIDKVSSDNKGDHGRSQRLIRKQLINVHGYRSTIKNMYLLEVHPALAVINRLTQALEHTLSEFLNHIKPASVQADLLIALSEWTNMKSCGTSYSYRIERDLFSSSYVEDPRFIIELGHSNIKSKEFQTGHHSSSMRQKLAMDVWNRLLEIVLTRHRLIDAAWETEILTSIYRTQANELNKEEFHLFLRPIPFELAEDHKEGQCKHGYASEDELANIALDRYLPSHLLLAIQELDEKHISTFNFRSKEGIVQLLNNNDMENLKTVLYAQVVHKNCLLAAILLNYVCCGLDECITSRETEHSERKSTTGSQYSFKLTAASQSSLTTKIEERYETFADLEAEKPIPFVSIQLHKLPLRDQMLREFSNKQAQVYNPIRNYEDIPTIKRGFVRVFFSKLVDVFQIYSLKAQIIAYFNSIRSLISSFPDIRQVQKRSSSFLSEDGSKLFNLWYIPTYEEVIQMFKALPIKQSVQRLKDALKLVSTLHDICQYVIAFAKMGSSLTLSSVSKQNNTGIKANWGGIEGIVNELREVQVQIDMLENPEDPQAVTNLLDMRRNLIFQQLDVCLRYSARETLLALNKENSYVTIVNSLNAHRVQFQDSDQCSIFALSMVVPDPIDIRSELSQTVFPWKTFQSRFGIYPLSYHQWSNLGKYIENCFTRLSQDEM
ncbi:uncharacterized protein TRIADDRAFT_52371 [Trichoplax adhaerens]|uniref:DUF4549 domain-containing protein n=1 Tax=Trichoplax adhaerens TaxID=10228 RepID=B3RI70_TRIAD|nr:hypothetical protein TRIADDRAFT_52371 [Trichoplax adhaerens]EDV29701.1 hypothetical protein TRIADDRAFT_52371 [Trichoplax adhaerens]|eukprot:XP_002108903.1 hypothetical protein TRIADDRAFT_52371 [Trichoplax adhaerens]